MNTETTILSISLILQIAAALLAIRLYRKPPRPIGWLMVSCALILMSIRRFISLSGRIGFSFPLGESLMAESTALLISVIMFGGIWLMRPLLRRSREVSLTKSENAELKQKETRFRELFNNMRSGVVVYRMSDTGDDFVISDFNRSAERIDGVTRSSILGRRVTDVFPQIREFGLLDVIQRVYQTGKPEHLPVSLYTDKRITGWRENFIYKLPSNEVVAIYDDVSERMRMLDDLQKKENLYRSLVEQGTGLVYRSLPNTTLTFVNEAYCRLYGKKREELLGEYFIEMTQPSYRADVKKTFATLTPDEPRRTLIEQVTTPTGEQRWIEWYIHGLFGKRDTLREVQGLGFDVTERRNMEKELRQSNIELELAMNHAKGLAEEAETASQAKTVFLANMSHELRTPLNAVMGCTDLLNTTTLSNEQTEYVKTINEGAQVLLGTITEILDLAKIEAGKLQPEPVLFNLRKMLVNTLSLLDSAAKHNHNQLSLECPDDMPEMVKGDRQKLQQVLTNLLNNSIKFTQGGHVTLAVTPQTETDLFEFKVIDTGIGITEEDLAKIFKPFEQAKTGFSKQGTGLGLPISSKLVEIMDGELRATSSAGEGSCFYFSIPLPPGQAQDEGKKVGKPVIPEESSDTEDLRIILAEDNEVNQLMTRRMLKKVNLKTDAVTDGNALLAQLKNKDYNVILMDVQMPRMDGLTATREIRKYDQSTYIIGLTAFAYEKDKRDCYDAGMNDFVAKPIRHHQLIEALERAKAYWNKQR